MQLDHRQDFESSKVLDLSEASVSIIETELSNAKVTWYCSVVHGCRRSLGLQGILSKHDRYRQDLMANHVYIFVIWYCSDWGAPCLKEFQPPLDTELSEEWHAGYWWSKGGLQSLADWQDQSLHKDSCSENIIQLLAQKPSSTTLSYSMSRGSQSRRHKPEFSLICQVPTQRRLEFV